jgi:hypothetical protein
MLGMQGCGVTFGRALRDGLLGKARALFHGLGRSGEYPSRKAFRAEDTPPELIEALGRADYQHLADIEGELK